MIWLNRYKNRLIYMPVSKSGDAHLYAMATLLFLHFFLFFFEKCGILIM